MGVPILKTETHELIGTQHVPREALKKWIGENALRIGFRPQWRGNVFYAIPVMEMVYSRWAIHTLTFLTHAWRDGDVIASRAPTIVHLARQELLERFLESHCEWLLWIDSDTVPPPDALEQLLGTGEKAVSGLYHAREEPYYPQWYSKVKWSEEDGKWLYENFHNPPSDRVSEIAGCGLGCFLVHREVCEKLDMPAFPLAEDAEDHAFTQRIRQAGYKIYGHPGVQCGHVGSTAITTDHWLAMNEWMNSIPFFTDRPALVDEYSEYTGEDQREAMWKYKDDGDFDNPLFFILRDSSIEFAQMCEPLSQLVGARVLVYGDRIGSIQRKLGETDRESNDMLPWGESRAPSDVIPHADAVVVVDVFSTTDDLDKLLDEISGELRKKGQLWFNLPLPNPKRPHWHVYSDILDRMQVRGLTVQTPPVPGSLGVAIRE